jgi:hypothetical protein
MNFIFSRLFLIIWAMALSSPARAFLAVEPYVGFTNGSGLTSFKNQTDYKHEYNGRWYGIRAAFKIKSFYLGVDHSQNDFVMDSFQGSAAASDLVNQRKTGVYLGRHWGRWRTLFHYNFKTILEGRDSQKSSNQFISEKESYEGKGYGITLSRFFGRFTCLNIGYYQTYFDDYAIQGNSSAQHNSTVSKEINISLSLFFGR